MEYVGDTLEDIIRQSETEEQLNEILDVIEPDENLTLAALETRARIVSTEVREIEELSSALLLDDDDEDTLLLNVNENEVSQSGGRMKTKHVDDQNDLNDHSLPDEKRQRTLSETHETQSLPSPISSATSQPIFQINEIKEVNIKKFNTRGVDYGIQFNNNIDASGVDELHPILHNAFEEIIDRVASGIPGHDHVRMVLHTPQLQYPIALPFMRRDQLNAERFLTRVEKVLQSHESFSLDGTVNVNFIHATMPVGGGRNSRKIINVDKYFAVKRSIISIRNNDNLCLASALLVARAKIYDQTQYKMLIERKSSCLSQLAERLHQDASVPLGPCGLEEVKKFQNHFNDIQINIVSRDMFNAIVYSGPESENRVYLLLHDKHFDVITSMPAFLNRKKYCAQCNKGYDHEKDHICNSKCNICFQGPCEITHWIYCDGCNRYFKNRQCFINHVTPNQNGNSLCMRYMKCRECNKIVKRINQAAEAHHCGQVKCNTCKEFVQGEHLCYMQPVDEDNGESTDSTTSRDESVKFLFYDYETMQETGTHVPNLVIVQDQDGEEKIFKGANANDEFCEWLFSGENKNVICFAHNSQAFDGYFVLSYLNRNAICPTVTMNGAKILSMEVKEQNIKFLDSLAFLPMKLSALPKTFGLNELRKGYFPHFFNTEANQYYVGPLPDPSFYGVNGMHSEEREKFLEWHTRLTSNNYVFEMEKEIEEYCRSDVDILRRSCLEFRRLFIETTDVDPFEKCITIASACNLVFRKNFLQPETIAIIPPHGYVPQHKQSVIAIKWLSYLADTQNIDIQHALNSGEQQIGPYRVDGYHRETNTVFELYGDFWHGCPKCHARKTRNPVTGNSMQELYEKTLRRRDYLQAEGYTIVEKWECDLKKELTENPEMREYFDSFHLSEPIEPRHALYGGRTNATRLYHKVEEGEKIKYVDFTSLYPWTNKYCEYPLGHPDIISENFGPLDQYFGLIKCTVLPPRGLYHPVLPYRTNNKLLFPLCRSCADYLQQEPCEHNDDERAINGTWVSVELMKALEKGYQVVRVDQVWHFPEKSDELFRLYIDKFLKIKQESSGFPSWCVSEDEKQQYITEYRENEGIRLDYDKIRKNPGLRALAKLMLNSFWGKFAQKANMMQVEMVKDPDRYFDLLTSDAIEVHDVRFINDDIVEIHFLHSKDFIPANAKTNSVLAAFTTAHARLKLYSVLESLGVRVLYFDTDSIIFLCKDGEWEPEIGDYLGDLTSETGNEYIVSYVSGGPKNYAYELSDGSTCCKVRGITLNYRNLCMINFDTISRMVRSINSNDVITVTNPCKIVRNFKTRSIISGAESKDYRVVYTKRVIVDDFNTLPYGY